MHGHDRPEHGDDDRESGGANVRPKRDRSQRLPHGVAGTWGREVGGASRPREHDGAEREVLLALEEETHRGGMSEDLLLEALAVANIEPDAQRRTERHRSGRERDGEVRSTLAVPEDDRWVDEEGRSEPAEMTVHMLEQTQRIERHRPREKYHAGRSSDRHCDTLALVECAAHAGTPVTERCSACERPSCERCLVYDVNGQPACDDCGASEDDRGRALGAALLAVVSVGYLATLAIGYLVFRARPFVGGLAAVIAIVLGRALQIFLRPPVVTRRERRTG